MTIAIQGEIGCFHQIAAHTYFNTAVEVLCCSNFRVLVQEVQRQKNCQLGIMAIENSIAGSILQNYNLLQQSGLSIIGEIYLPIVQNLIALPGTKLQDVEEIYSHPMAIYQCYHFLNQLPQVKLVEKEDTAGSVKEIKNAGLKNKAAIAGSLAAEIYGMEILASAIESNHKNYTRFLIIGTKPHQAIAKTNKASICFSVPHHSGSLAKVLAVIAAQQINLTKIQSYPILGAHWQYYFYVDVEYDSYQNFEKMYAALISLTKKLTLMGNYVNGL